MNESLKNVPEGAEAESEAIEAKIASLKDELTRLEKDNQFPPAVKNRLMGDIRAELTKANLKQMALADKKSEVIPNADENKEANDNAFSDAVERAEAKVLNRQDRSRNSGAM